MEDWQIALAVIAVPVVIALLVFAAMRISAAHHRHMDNLKNAFDNLVKTAEEEPDATREFMTHVSAMFSKPEKVQSYADNLARLRQAHDPAGHTSLTEKARKLKRLKEDYEKAIVGLSQEERQEIYDLYEQEKIRIKGE
jgi:hypothetical protein